MSVTASSPENTPSSPNVRCGAGPNDVVPSEKFHTNDVIGHAEVVLAEKWTGEPSEPENGPSGAIVGSTLFALRPPKSSVAPAPSSSKSGDDVTGVPNAPSNSVILNAPMNGSRMPIAKCGCCDAAVPAGAQ